MTAWPKSFLTFGANLLTARAALRLRRRSRSARVQGATFRRLVAGLAAGSYWRAAGVRAGMTYGEFRTQVPIRRPADLAGAVTRMSEGERDLLWPGLCELFGATSGTTSGEARLVPITEPMLAHFRAGCVRSLLHYTARVGNAGIFRGQFLFLTGSTQLKQTGRPDRHRAFAGTWPAIAALNVPDWLEPSLCVPREESAKVQDWEQRLDVVVARAHGADVTLLAGIPSGMLSLVEHFRRRDPSLVSVRRMWPNLECCLFGGEPIGPYHAELRTMFGPEVIFHETYAAAEGIFAVQDTPASGQLRVLDDVGVFFEFLPLSSYEEARAELPAGEVVPLAEVKTGVDYVMLVTTPGGLARYVVGDIVRFASTEPPRLTYVGRTALQLSAFGERVPEKDLADALQVVCERHCWSIVNFHVSPLFGKDLTGQARGRHEWWVELRPGTKETPTGPQMAAELDLELQRLNREYSARRNGGRIDAPTVRLVMPGVFRHWLWFHGRWGGENRMARCRSDRLIADELAQITRFAGDQA